MPGPNVALRDEVPVLNCIGTQESEIMQHGLGESQSDFSLAIANDDFSNDTFEREETNIDDDNISLGSEDGDFGDDGVEDVEEEDRSTLEMLCGEASAPDLFSQSWSPAKPALHGTAACKACQ